MYYIHYIHTYIILMATWNFEADFISFRPPFAQNHSTCPYTCIALYGVGTAAREINTLTHTFLCISFKRQYRNQFCSFVYLSTQNGLSHATEKLLVLSIEVQQHKYRMYTYNIAANVLSLSNSVYDKRQTK